MPFFSIVVPVYNTEKYLQECIDSVKKQTFNEWELILVDDGSTDSSLLICRGNAEDDDRIKVYHKENSGQFETRIFGIDKAVGEYCFCLDSDDLLSPELLERVFESVTKYKVDVVMWDIEEFGNSNKRYSSEIPKNEILNAVDYIKSVIKETNHSLCNKAVLTSILKNVDYQLFDNSIRISEDYMQIISVLVNTHSAVYLGEALYLYRKTGNSTTNRVDYVASTYDLVRASDYVINILDNSQILDDELRLIEAKAFLITVLPRIWGGIISGSFNHKNRKQIATECYYKNIKYYEKIGIINISGYVILKSFRYNLYPAIKLIHDMKRK